MMEEVGRWTKEVELTAGQCIHYLHPVDQSHDLLCYLLSWSPMVKSPSYTSSLKTNRKEGTFNKTPFPNIQGPAFGPVL